MGKSVHKVIYKPNTQSTEEYIVIVDPTEYNKWKEGDTSIGLALVVDSFDIFHSTQGNQGKLGRASKQQLETIFGDVDETEMLKVILEKGSLQASGGISSGGASLNDSRGGANIDTRGSGGSLRG